MRDFRDMDAPRPFGKYELLERVAMGGMAEIYRARLRGEAGFQKILCIKKILPHLAREREFLEMFEEEAKLGAELEHANIVQVFDFGREGGDSYLAMEFVRGPNLREVILRCRERQDVVPVPLALFIAAEAAKALAYAHARTDAAGKPLNLIHRDVSPANLLVSWEGDVKVADFGIARAMSRAGRTADGQVRGKASYMSPEHASGMKIDARADLFALGIVLWETLTGMQLFRAPSEVETMSLIVQGTARSPSSARPGIPADVDALVARALEPDRDKRFPSATAMHQSIRATLQAHGGATTLDLARFLQERFPAEIEASERQKATDRALSPSPSVESESSSVEPLSHDARRKLFDLPEPPRAAAAAAPAPAPPVPAASDYLELDTARASAALQARDAKVMARVHVGSHTARIARLSALGIAAGALLLWGVTVLYRY